MALVKKLNTELTVPDEKVKECLEMGYSLIDDSGKVLEAGKTTSKDEYIHENLILKEEIEKLKSDNLSKDQEINELKTSLKELKKQLKKENKESPEAKEKTGND